MAESKLSPLQYNVPIVFVDKNGVPTPYLIDWFQTLMEELGLTAELAEDAVPQGTVGDSGLTIGSNRIAGNNEAAVGPIEELSLSEVLDMVDPAVGHGDILFRGAAGWEVLAPGTIGHFLSTQGVGADPSWVAGGGGGGGGGALWYFNPPAAADFTVDFNDGTAPVMTDDADIGLRLDFGAPVAGDKHRIKAKVVPAGDWEVTVHINPTVPNNNYSGVGIEVIDSATNRTYMFSRWNNAQLVIQNWTLPSSYGGAPWTAGTGMGGTIQPAWLRIARSGLNLVFSVSGDGKNFCAVYTIAMTSWLANPSHIGFSGAYNRTTQGNNFLAVDYWLQSW